MMTQKINKEIANNIWNQMKAIDLNLVMCMGVNSPLVVENGLRFKVRGLTFKGFIEITLNGKDLYDIHCFTKRKEKVFTKHQLNDIYVEDLMPILEGIVERGCEDFSNVL